MGERVPKPEQVPEIQERVDRQRADRASATFAVDEKSDTSMDAWDTRRWLWILVAVSAAGFALLGLGQGWLFRRPRAMGLFNFLIPVGFAIVSALLVSGIVGLVVTAVIRRERRRSDLVPRVEVLVRLHADGVIDDAELARNLGDTVR